eukprot:symbB.v1.2.001694.t1/scaffold93.1/size335462/9
MDFVRWIVENPLLDVLVKNNQNEDAIDVADKEGLHGIRMVLESTARLQAEEQAVPLIEIVEGVEGLFIICVASLRLKGWDVLQRVQGMHFEAFELRDVQELKSAEEVLASFKALCQLLARDIAKLPSSGDLITICYNPGRCCGFLCGFLAVMTHGEGVNIQVGPVPKGQIRLEGHFCGVATTSSHRLELAIPINEEVDINLLYPLLNGFQASREAKGDFEEASPASPMDPELWKTLEKLLEADRKDLEDEEGEVVEDLLECMGPNWKSMTSGLTGLPGETARLAPIFVLKLTVTTRLVRLEPQGAAGSRRNSLTFQRSSSTESVDELQAKLKDEERELRATKAHERAMEIDFQAKEALVQNLMEERSKLRAKTQELTKQLETNVAERWLCSCFGGFGKLFQKSEDDQLESIAEALEEREEAAVKSELGRASELGEGQAR